MMKIVNVKLAAKEFLGVECDVSFQVRAMHKAFIEPN
jgi:hypothetical protein